MINRNYKDTIFRKLFSETDQLLSLYNAINKTSYTDPSDFKVTTLDNAVYMNMKNDVSFIVSTELNIYEHQSTLNPNMPLRSLHYVSKSLELLISKERLYGTKPIAVPFPCFIVFYNGEAPAPERMEYRISDLYDIKDRAPNLELVVTFLNINDGNNQEIRAGCRVLDEYMQYVGLIRRIKNEQGLSIEDAVEQAITYCISSGILADFLSKNRKEAVKMSIFEYDEDAHMKLLYEEGKEDGLEQGREEGREEGIKESLLGLYKDGIIDASVVASKLGIDVSEVDKLMTE